MTRSPDRTPRGLLEAALRSLVIAATITLTIGTLKRWQSRTWPDRPTSRVVAEVERLGRLHDAGSLSDAEFARAKDIVLRAAEEHR